MVLLAKSDIATQEVLDWQGIHLLHFSGSTCSKKIRIMLDLKNIDWVSHPINLIKRENNTDWFMGINPRGLVPVLVHDGQVHIESNDILDYLDQLHSKPALMSGKQSTELKELLQAEDKLHVDLRNLTMRFTAPTKLMQRSKEQLEHFTISGTGTIDGKPDSHKADELEYWRNFSLNSGVSNTQIIESVARFKQTLDKLELRLESASYLLGNNVSLSDISWFVTVNRILLAGYPLQRLHPKLWAWRELLLKTPAFTSEEKAPFLQRQISNAIWIRDKITRRTLVDIAEI